MRRVCRGWVHGGSSRLHASGHHGLIAGRVGRSECTGLKDAILARRATPEARMRQHEQQDGCCHGMPVAPHPGALLYASLASWAKS